MCGIIAGISDPIAPILLEGLKRVEYRGYDSVGVATVSDGRILLKKDVGRVEALEAKYAVSTMPGHVGIAHTRWATHGGVTTANAHPHLSCDESIAVVHNGIIENYLELKSTLVKRGHVFRSETDTEVIAHLIEQASKRERDPLQATLKALRKVKGQYAVVVMFAHHPNLLIGARNDAPLVVGLGKREFFLASDVLAFISRTDRAVFLENMDVACISPRGLKVYNMQGKEVKRKVTQLAWELADVSKQDFAHYTLKEIHEQPETVQRAMLQDPLKLEAFAASIKNAGTVLLTASGSSFHAALLLKGRLNREAKVRCDAVLAGEFDHQTHFVDKDTVMIAFSQSGETADLLEAVKRGREAGAKILSVVNAVGSTLARESDAVLLLNCGPEVGVAATKSFTAQVMVGNMIADAVLGRRTVGDPKKLAGQVEEALESESTIKDLALRFRDRPDFYFIARGPHYPVAQEGALKLKELSYIHAEGIPASELKHGTLALIEKGTPVVVIARSGEGLDAIISNATELKARGAEIIGVSDVEHPVFSYRVPIPTSNESVSPVLEVDPPPALSLPHGRLQVERP